MDPSWSTSTGGDTRVVRSMQGNTMPRCSGSADLPLHGGRVRRRLGVRMTRLGAVISQAIVCHYGRVETEASMSAIPNALIV